MSLDKDILFSILVNIKEAYFQEYAYDQQVKTQFKQNCNPQNMRMDRNLFIKFISNKTDGVTQQQILEIFKLFDKNNSGTINFDEFQKIFQEIRYLKPQIVKQAMVQNQQKKFMESQQQQQQNQFSPVFNVSQEINPQTNQKNINLDIFVKDINQKQDVQIDLKMLQQNSGATYDVSPQFTINQGQPYYQNQPIVNPLMDFKQQPIQQNQQNTPSGRIDQQNNYQNVPGQLINNNNNNNNPKANNFQSFEDNMAQLNLNNNQQKNQPTQQQNPPSKYPVLKQPENKKLYENQNVVNQLIGNTNIENNNNNQNNQNQNRNNNLNHEDTANNLLMKLSVLKQKHQSKQINILNIKNVYQTNKISFRELIQFLSTLGLSLSANEELIFKKLLLNKDNDQLYIKDFLSFMSLKDTYQEQLPVQPPQQIQNQQYPNLQPNKINNIQAQKLDIKVNQQNNAPNKPVINLPPPPPPPPQQPNYQKDTGQNINILQSSIQARYFFEVDDQDLIGYKQFIQIFEDCQKSNKKFIDQSFKPIADSIVTDSSFRKYNEWRQLKWLRPDEFLKQYEMFTKIQSMQTSRIGLGKLITPYDIQQGMLGDCYFLSALSSLANEPLRILNLFKTRIVNQFGIYCVKICFDGEWRAVYVDDNIPCKYDKPAFSKASENEIWVLILEKAWAKLFKSYQAIESGFCREALRDLTGAPTKTIETIEEDDIEGKIIKRQNEALQYILRDSLSKNNKFVVTAGAEDEDVLTKSSADRLGLVNSHAYSIIGIKDISHPQLGNVTLLRLRNPWGKQEWKGNWSDNSNCWTPELREKLRICNKDDGIFYMSIQDFQKYFSDACVCYYHDDFKYNSFRINNSSPKRSQYTQLKINTAGTYYISLVQPNKRNFHEKYKYSTSRLFISQIVDQNNNKCIKYIGAIQKKDREIFIECNLQPGQYVIQSKVFWESNQTSTYVISTYGVSNTQLIAIEKKKVPPFIEQCLLQKANKNTKLKPFQKYPDIFKGIDFSIKEGFGYYYIKNNSNKTLDMEVTFKSTSNIKIMKPLRLPIIKCVVLPKQEFIAPVTVSSTGYSYSCSESYLVS